MAKKNNLYFDTYEAAAEWFEESDMTDYEERLKPVEFYFDLRKDRDWVELDHDLAKTIRLIAKEKDISTRLLVNKWLHQAAQHAL